MMDRLAFRIRSHNQLRSRHRWALMAACLSLVPGCGGTKSSAEAKPPPIQSPPPTPPPAPGSCPSIEELRGALGQAQSSPSLTTLLTKLGEPTAREGTDAGSSLQRFDSQGVSLHFDGQGVLRKVDLHRASVMATQRWLTYCSTLPLSLEFGMTSSKVHSLLKAKPTAREATELWPSLGLELRYSAGYAPRLFLVSLVEPPPPPAPPPPLPPEGQILVSVESSKNHVPWLGVDRVEVLLQCRAWKRLSSKDILAFSVRLKDAAGKPVRARYEHTSLDDDSGVVQLRTGSPDWPHAKASIPYYILDLPPGKHRLTLELEAVPGFDPLPPDKQLTTRIEGDASFEIEMPEVHWVSAKVTRLVIQEGRYDDPLNLDRASKRQLDKADPMWTIKYPGLDTLYTSPARQDSHDARWSQGSGFFPLAMGDRVTLLIEDQDATFHDKLDSFELTREQLLEGATLNGSKALRVELGKGRERR